jgi:hypothetical protein
MPNPKTNIRTRFFSGIFILILTLSGNVAAQDLRAYSLQCADDIFARETERASVTVPIISHMPKLNCSIEYLRRLDGKDIVYRRGPIALHQSAAPANDDASSPASPESEKPSVFTGGMVVDFPRAGESSETLPVSDKQYNCMFRASIVPSEYKDAVLKAKIFIERAVVRMEGTTVIVIRNEVFSRTVELVGNKPLNFDLPPWEEKLKSGVVAIPSALQESILLTLEIPQHFAFGKNIPEPFVKNTTLSYALPQAANINLSISIQGKEKVLDQGYREAGTHDVAWDAGNVPDGNYNATLKATNDKGLLLNTSNISLTKDKTAADTFFPAAGRMPTSERFSLSTEAGASYLLPADQKKGLRNMFTHIAMRIGYAITSKVEVGLLLGQDSFNEKPGTNVDIDRIVDYGGVVPYTYGYAGPYLRLKFGNSPVQPLLLGSVAFSSASTIAELGFGLSATLLSRIQVFVMPDLLIHFRQPASTKAGLVYGVSVKF